MKKYILKPAERSDRNFTIDYHAELNNEQYAVVTAAEGPCLVLAGAGSGKTRTLVYRVAYLIEKGVSPENIMLVTFTNKAAREMLNRVELLLRHKPRGLVGGTFHSVANSILRRYSALIGYQNNFNILDEDDSLSLIKSSLADLDVDTKDKYFPKPKVLAGIISFAANSGAEIGEVIKDRYEFFKPEFLGMVENLNQLYQRKKQLANVMDFDDLLVNLLKLLRARPDVKLKLSEQFKYVLVDEYQDTNKIQALIMDELASAHRNLLVVGDDSQSIYSFRAATVSNILDFPKKYHGCKIFKLETNYRSVPEILALANNSILHNPEQFSKKLKSLREAGNKPVLAAAKDGEEQANFIVNRILDRRDEGLELKDMAVLFRSSYQIIELELELNKRGLPYVVRGGLRFFEQAHIKDVVAFLRVAANFRDELSWARILGLQANIGRSTINKIWLEVSKAMTLEEILLNPEKLMVPARAERGWLNVVKILREILSFQTGEKAVARSLRTLLDSDYQNYLKNNYENFKDRLEDLEQLEIFAGSYDSLEKFLTDVSLSEGFRGERVEKNKQPADDEVLVLTTIHQAKGLEWRVVFVLGLAEGQFPHHKVYANPRELNEERRLFYVAITRAKDELYLAYPIFSFSYSTGESINRPSRFVEEVESGLLETWELTTDDSYNQDSEDLVDEDGEEVTIEYL